MYPYDYSYNGMQNNAQNGSQSLVRVTGTEGAKAYQMPPNSTVALFDGGEDIMYIKSTDGAGFPTIRTFQFTEVNPTPEYRDAEYVTRGDFEKLKEELIGNVKQLIRNSETNTEPCITSNVSNAKHK